MPTRFDVVFEGGGAKGIALSGAVSALLDAGHALGRLVGTSAGAITATNLALGYTPGEILAGSLVRTPSGAPIYTTFSEPPVLTEAELAGSGLFSVLRHELAPIPGVLGEHVDLALARAMGRLPGVASLVLLGEGGGLHRGDGFVRWMQGCLSDKGVPTDATFADLHARTGRDLSVVATDTTDRRLLVLNHRTAPELPVVMGVRMSMSIPLYWTEVVWDAAWGRYRGEDVAGHAIVDGGVVSNFPLFLLTDPTDDEVAAVMGPPDPSHGSPVGLMLDPDLPVAGAPPPSPPTALHGLHRRLSALLDTLLSARDNAVSDAHAGRIVRLPVEGYGTTEFDMPEPRVRALYDAAAAAARAWLDRSATAEVTA
ncbi:MAG: patatin-like phospholipase family protein [Myxococcota bacterium]